jgi:hypothetical protein
LSGQNFVVAHSIRNPQSEIRNHPADTPRAPTFRRLECDEALWDSGEQIMAVFYVLPPRPALGECLARLLRSYVPGVSIESGSCAEMIANLVNEASQEEEAYVVHREDLPDGDDVSAALCNGYGAEPGDQVVWVALGSKLEEPRVRISRVAA